MHASCLHTSLSQCRLIHHHCHHTTIHLVDCECSLKEVILLSHAGPKVWDHYANNTGGTYVGGVGCCRRHQEEEATIEWHNCQIT